MANNNFFYNARNNKPATSKIDLGFGYLVIGLIIILGILLYLYYDELFKQKKEQMYQIIDNTPIDINEKFQKRFTITKIIKDREYLLKEGEGHGIQLYWEMYIPDIVNNYNWKSSYDKLKPIILFGESPHIFYHPKTGELTVVLKYRDNPYYAHYPHLKLEIPLQKWNRILVKIDNREVTIYVNDKLELATTLMNVPIISMNYADVIQIGEKGNNIRGKLKNMKLIY